MSEARLRARLMDLISTKLVVKPLYVIARLGIPDQLQAGPQSAEQLARSTDTHAPTLLRVLRCVASSRLGILRECEPEHFELGPGGHLLCSGPQGLRPHLLWYHDPWSDHVYESFLHSVRTGGSAVVKTHGRPQWEHFADRPDLERLFEEMLVADADQKHALLAGCDWSGTTRLVDVGGGPSVLMTRVLADHPQLRGVVYDAPSRMPAARERLEAAGLLARCDLEAGDFRQGVPAGDAHLLSFVLHDWNDDDALAILRHCHRAQPADGRLLLLEGVLPPDNQPSLFRRMDMHMLAIHGGRERTEDELRSLLAQAGFRLERVVTPAPNGPSRVEARRVQS